MPRRDDVSLLELLPLGTSLALGLDVVCVGPLWCSLTVSDIYFEMSYCVGTCRGASSLCWNFAGTLPPGDLAGSALAVLDL